MALRSAVGEIDTLAGCWAAVGGSSAPGPYVAALRGRLAVHLDDAAARESFTATALHMLHLQ